MTIRYGISLASLLPWSMQSWFWPWGSPTRAARWAKEAGYEFLQVLPFRGTTGREQYDLPVLYKEGAWNAAFGLCQVLRHQLGAAGMPSGPLDLVFFPDPLTCRRVVKGWKARFISHSFKMHRMLVEICPELEMTSQEIAAKCEIDNIQLVLDTEHLVRDRRPFDSNFGKKPHPFFPGVNLSEGEMPDFGAIRAAIEPMAHHIVVIHVKSVAPGTIDRQIISALMDSPDRRDHLDAVAEYKPPRNTLFNLWAARRYMADFLHDMRVCIEG